MQISIVKTFPVLLAAATMSAALALDGIDGARAAADVAVPTVTQVSDHRFEGAYVGTLGGPGGARTPFQLLVLPEGDFFAIYGDSAAAGVSVRGYIHGSEHESASGGWRGSGREFGIEAASGVELNATPGPDAAVAGTVTGADGLVSPFSGTPIPVSTFDYNRPAQLSSIVGTWAMATPYDQRATLAIGQDAGLTGSVDGCKFSGRATPAPSRNVFNIAMTFGGEPCVLVGQTARGIALAHQLPDGRQQLMVMVQDDARNEGGMLVGSRRK